MRTGATWALAFALALEACSLAGGDDPSAVPAVPTATHTPTPEPTETARPTQTQVPTAPPSPTAIPPFRSTPMALYQARDFPFSIQIPAGWDLADEKSTAGREFAVYRDANGAIVLLESVDLRTRPEFPGQMTLDDYLAAFMPTFAQGGLNVQIVTNERRVSAQGIPYQFIVNTEGVRTPDLLFFSTWARLFTMHAGALRFSAEYLTSGELSPEFRELIEYCFGTLRVEEGIDS